MNSSSVSIDRLEAIAEEVMALLDTDSIFGFLIDSDGNLKAVENRLQELMRTRRQYECIELAMYLRTSSSRRTHFMSWQPLLNASIEMAHMRGEDAEGLFFGMMPARGAPARNTNRLK